MREKREKDSAFQLESVHAVSPCVGRSEILTWRREKMHRDCLEFQSSRNGWRNFHSLPRFYILPLFLCLLSPAVFFLTPSHASMYQMVKGIRSGSKERKTKLKTVTSSSAIFHEFSSVFCCLFKEIYVDDYHQIERKSVKYFVSLTGNGYHPFPSISSFSMIVSSSSLKRFLIFVFPEKFSHRNHYYDLRVIPTVLCYDLQL